VPKTASELPIWKFDGSSTGQAEGSNANVYVLPVQLYNDPFRGGDMICETIRYNKIPTESNDRQLKNSYGYGSGTGAMVWHRATIYFIRWF